MFRWSRIYRDLHDRAKIKTKKAVQVGWKLRKRWLQLISSFDIRSNSVSWQDDLGDKGFATKPDKWIQSWIHVVEEPVSAAIL